MSRRRRALVLFGLAGLCAALAATLTSSYAAGVRSQVGPLVPVLAASADVPRGIVISSRNARRYFAARRVAERFAPAARLERPEDVLGLATAVRIPAGAFVDQGQLRNVTQRSSSSPELERGQRAVEVAASGAAGLAGALEPGSRVDVLVTTERGQGGGRTFIALDDVEVLAAAPPGEQASRTGAAEDADVVATLRVTVRQAVFLAAAQNFAREVRLLPRAPGDDRPSGGPAVDAGGLGP